MRRIRKKKLHKCSKLELHPPRWSVISYFQGLTYIMQNLKITVWTRKTLHVKIEEVARKICKEPITGGKRFQDGKTPRKTCGLQLFKFSGLGFYQHCMGFLLSFAVHIFSVFMNWGNRSKSYIFFVGQSWGNHTWIPTLLLSKSES